jgi:hypothetical protein
MCQAAWAASHTGNTYLASFYKRIRFRKGPQKAIMALAHHMITVVYNVLMRREEYVELGGDFYDQRNKPKVVSRLVSRLAKLGYQVELTETQPAPSQGSPELSDTPAVQHLVPLPTRAESQPAPAKRRGRPCKCIERGITCKHQRLQSANSLDSQGLSEGRFS